MENKDYIDLIKQTYEDKINLYKDQITLYERLLKEQERTINKQESEISDVKNMADKFYNDLISMTEQLKQSKSVNIEITNTNEGGNMSNINQTSSGSGDNINNQLDNVKMGGGFAGKEYQGDVINNESSSNLEEIVNKINQLIEQKSQTNPNNTTSDRFKIVSIVIEPIETNPTWKQKAIKACKQGLLEAMKSNPIGALVAGAIEGWKEQ